jgi:hypothetical protein
MNIFEVARKRRDGRRQLSKSRQKALDEIRRLEDEEADEISRIDYEDEDVAAAAVSSVNYQYGTLLEPLRKRLRVLDELLLRDSLDWWSIDVPERGPDFLREGRKALKKGQRETIEWWVKAVFSPTISVIALIVAIVAAFSRSCPSAAQGARTEPVRSVVAEAQGPVPPVLAASVQLRQWARLCGSR